MIRVAFFAHLAFHRPIVQPIMEALGTRCRCLLSDDRRAIVAFDPDVLVMTSHACLEYFRHHLPRALAVNVRHGMIGKAIVHRLPRRSSARRFDFVCVGAEARIESYARAQAEPGAYWLTGYPQLDPLFRRDPPPRLPLDPRAKTVLYAPTWNLGLSSAGMLGARLVELIRAEAPGVNVIIKPHPVIGEWRPEWMACWERLAAAGPGVHLVRDTHADVTAYMLAADALISDASSTVFEFLALDRPIILITNSLHRADPAYEAEDIIWRWRDVGEEVRDPAALPGAVARALGDPGARGDWRKHYAGILFGALTDGRNHERVAERILAVGAERARAERRPAQAPVIPTAPVWLWHDLKTRLLSSAPIRRILMRRFEAMRLRARSRKLGPSGP